MAERAHDRLSVLADAVAIAIAEQRDGRFAFFGHSMGGLLSFEVARALRRRGAAAPDHLFVSASRPAHLWSQFEHLHLLPEREFRAALARMGGTPAALLADDDFMSLVSPTLRRDFAAVADYRYVTEAPLDSHLHVLAAVDDTVMPFSSLHEWQRHTRGRFSLHTFTGGHFYISRARAAAQDVIARMLEIETAQVA